MLTEVPMTVATRTTTEATARPPVEIPAAPPARPVEWIRALRALRELLAYPDRTEKAFEIFLALDGDSEERRFRRLLADPQGAQLVAERPSLLDRLGDRAGLAALPDGSLGRAYLAYLERTGLDLKSEMEAHAAAIGQRLPVLDSAREWYRVRGILLHDLWHVLTEYGTDDLGEAALLAFTHAQVGGRANRFLMVGATLRAAAGQGIGFVRYMVQAWRRGRRARRLIALPYEALLAEPLDNVRQLAAIEPAASAHPAGILAGSVRSRRVGMPAAGVGGMRR
jgi:ubiquinone biosynthesis protein COQ4